MGTGMSDPLDSLRAAPVGRSDNGDNGEEAMTRLRPYTPVVLLADDDAGRHRDKLADAPARPRSLDA